MIMEFWGEVWAGKTNMGAVKLWMALKAMRLDANYKGQSIDRKQDQRLSPWAYQHLPGKLAGTSKGD